MIDLKTYREFWDSLLPRVKGLHKVMPITVSENMNRHIQRLGAEDTPVLFWTPPSAEAQAGSNCDTMTERNECVIFVMKKYDPQKSSALEALEQTLPVIEDIKRHFLMECATACSILEIEADSISTMPETTFYRDFAGWSIGFAAIT